MANLAHPVLVPLTPTRQGIVQQRNGHEDMVYTLLAYGRAHRVQQRRQMIERDVPPLTVAPHARTITDPSNSRGFLVANDLQLRNDDLALRR